MVCDMVYSGNGYVICSYGSGQLEVWEFEGGAVTDGSPKEDTASSLPYSSSSSPSSSSPSSSSSSCSSSSSFPSASLSSRSPICQSLCRHHQQHHPIMQKVSSFEASMDCVSGVMSREDDGKVVVCGWRRDEMGERRGVVEQWQ